MPMRRASIRTVGNPVLLSSRVKTKGRMILGMTVSTLFPQDPSVLGVKVLVTQNRSVLYISKALGRARQSLLL